MKVSYPLSLKVSLWLILNLLLLTVLGIGFFVLQGGLGWSALIAGPTGTRAQAKANIIAAEVAAAAPQDRAAVLERFEAAYGARLVIFRSSENHASQPTTGIPPAVQARIDAWRQFFRSSFGRDHGPGSGRGSRGGFGPHDRSEKDDTSVRTASPSSASPPSVSSSPASAAPPFPAPPKAGRVIVLDTRTGTAEAARERDAGRFIARTGPPAKFWISLRVPFSASERSRFVPALLVAQVDSFWALLHFLDLQAWLLAGAAVLFLSVLFWLPLVRGITRSLGQLTAATERIAEGHFDTRVPAQRRDELGKLGASVNRMATRLDTHMNGQKRFLGDVAHELCSPLARLQMATGILSDRAPRELQETVSDVREEVQQMGTLVNELLAFTKAGLRPREVVCRAVDLAPLAREAIAREGAADRIALAIPDELKVSAEPDLLMRALGNLVRNALRYAGDAGPIDIAAARDRDRVTLLVEDNGPGVPAADLDRLGEPFFRPELARTRESGGVGLGLAIVRNSIAACGGEVRFANRKPRGFRAELRLAAAP